MIEIMLTPETLTAHLQSDIPPQLIVLNKGFMFNKAAEVKLALKPQVKFAIVFEEGKIYYSEGAKDGFIIGNPSGRHKLLFANAHKLILFFDKQFKKKEKRYTFEIGEFKEGRRELKLI